VSFATGGVRNLWLIPLPPQEMEVRFMAMIKMTARNASKELDFATKNLTTEKVRGLPYRALELHEVGSLDKLHHYGSF
jgi:hypothetical protein